MKVDKLGSKGTTLIEIIISISILMIVITPALASFYSATSINFRSNMVMSATSYLQAAMGDIKNKSAGELDEMEGNGPQAEYNGQLPIGTKIYYTITKKEQEEDIYTGDLPTDITYNVEIVVNSSDNILVGLNSEAINNPYTLKIPQLGNIQVLNFNDDILYEANNPIDNDIYIKVNFIGGTDNLILNVNNEITDGRKVKIHNVAINPSRLILVKNGPGVFTRFDNIGTVPQDLSISLYKIELVAKRMEKGVSTIIGRLASYVKK